MSTSSASTRSSLVSNAVSFLRDPKTQEATLDKKLEFLKVKGLTPDEITVALQQVGVTTAPTSPASVVDTTEADGEFFAVPSTAIRSPPAIRYQQQQQPPPVNYDYDPRQHPYGVPHEGENRRDWKDWFVMAVVSGGVMVGMYSLARKFLFPHLVPPPLTAFQETQKAMETQFDLVVKQLADLAEQTEAQRGVAEEQKEQVGRTVEAVERALQDIQEGENRAKAELKEIRDEVANIRDMIPKLIQSSQSSATNTLTDVQQELKSLKALLSRPQPSFPLGPSSPLLASGSTYPYPSLPYSAGSNPQSSTPTPTPPYLPSGRPFIPSWQLASKNAAEPAEAGDKAEKKEDLDVSGVLVDDASAVVSAENEA